jgi:glycosyltransferase involved in cell wall biosynthesis
MEQLLSASRTAHQHASEPGSSLTKPGRRIRLVVLASHPIQYQVPLFRALAARPEIDLSVLFCSNAGVEAYQDEGFGREVKWDIPLLGGYRCAFLQNLSLRPDPSRFWGLVNPAVLRQLRREHVDAVLVHGWASVTNWLAMLTAFVSGIPVLLRGETHLLFELPRWKAVLKRTLLTRLFRRISAFLAIGRCNRDFYSAYGVPKDRIFHVPYAVDNGFFFASAVELSSQKVQLKQALGISPDLPMVLFVGKLLPKKGPADLLEAFARVTKKTQSALLYVGDGPLRAELEAEVRSRSLSNVLFVGFRNQSELPHFYAVADVFVLPSRFEPWGLVLNEAMCFGLPVIASDQVGASHDLIRDGENGFIFPAGDVSALENCLERLISGRALRSRMGEVSSCIIREWSFAEDVAGILDCLGDVLDRNRLPAGSHP